MSIIRDGTYDEVPQSPVSGWFFLQQFFVYPVVLIAGMPFVAFAYGLELLSGLNDQTITNGLVLIYAAVGFGLGSLTATTYPRLRISGQWIWILPLALFLWVLMDDFFRFGINPTKSFYSGGGEEALGLLLFTWPTFSLACYSLGMFFCKPVSEP